jgi:flagellar FliJ protein
MSTVRAAVRGDVPMASIESLVRSKRNVVEQRRRAVAQIQGMIKDFELRADSLDREIHGEEDRTKNDDPSHFAYSTLATATTQRRNNLKQSTDKLKIQLDAAERALRKATAELEVTTDYLSANSFDVSPAV